MIFDVGSSEAESVFDNDNNGYVVLMMSRWLDTYVMRINETYGDQLLDGIQCMKQLTFMRILNS